MKAIKMIHVSESLGWFCSILGSLAAWAFLQIKEAPFNILESAKMFVYGGFVLIVVGSGFMVMIAAMEKYNKYREKMDDKKFNQK